mmetsp:Transcript_2956/g.4240  ORF Transcript_2956/g.4240 Transcript_2956/m.4240 type:complete len:1015 (-) Transcript_2956:227-3271(-)
MYSKRGDDIISSRRLGSSVGGTGPSSNVNQGQRAPYAKGRFPVAVHQQSPQKRGCFNNPCRCNNMCTSTTCGSTLLMQPQIVKFLNSKFWRLIMIIFTLIMFFGSQIQILLDKKYDTVFDGIFIGTLLVLLSDSIMRAVVDPEYGIACGREGATKRYGSFVFWCDIISAVSIMWEISFIPNQLDAMNEDITISVNEYGTPEKGLTDVGGDTFPLNIDLLIIILRTARLSAFVRTLATFKPPPMRRFKQMSYNFVCQGFSNDVRERRRAAKLISAAWRDYVGRKNGGRPVLNRSPYSQAGNSSLSMTKEGTVRGNSGRSQVGQAMSELTAQRVHVGIILALLLTAIFTYVEHDATDAATMVVLFQQTQGTDDLDLKLMSLKAAADSVEGKFLSYTFCDDVTYYQTKDDSWVDDKNSADLIEPGWDDLREKEKLEVKVTGTLNGQDECTTTGLFSRKKHIVSKAMNEILATVFVLFVWVVGSMAFSSPVMVLVVVPIERMVRLLGMLTRDPLGYQMSRKFKLFMKEDEDIVKRSGWTKEIFDGMETAFLMTTILRIGSLMRVGFGTAGVQIIRDALGKDAKRELNLQRPGSTVRCIFFFCDIRQFTDATEALQEEVFVFTNRIAHVIHKICVAYGGSPNKNVGDAFLLSWHLDVTNDVSDNPVANTLSGIKMFDLANKLKESNKQADKALLSVVKIMISLHRDDYFLEGMSTNAKNRLIGKLSKRPGPLVQMGFGLHAGTAVQGAIGSQRKIDATYISVAVDRAETLEGLTKRYGLSILMSGNFYDLLSPTCRRRCRLVDKLLITGDDSDNEDEGLDDDENLLDLYTFDMDVKALYALEAQNRISDDDGELINNGNVRSVQRSNSFSKSFIRHSHRKSIIGNKVPKPGSGLDNAGKRRIPFSAQNPAQKAQSPDFADDVIGLDGNLNEQGEIKYDPEVWVTGNMRIIREKYTDGIFALKYNEGLQHYFRGDWSRAKQCFVELIGDKYEDGPSKYFMNEILKCKGVVPKKFTGYGSL